MQRTYAPKLLPMLSFISILGLLLVYLPDVAGGQAPNALAQRYRCPASAPSA